jgi:hypothetical protein
VLVDEISMRKRNSVTVFRSPLAALAAIVVFALTASVAPAQTPLRVDRARVGIVPGASATVTVSGVTGALTVAPSFDGVAAVYDAPTHRLLLTGRAPGSGTLALSDAGGNVATIAVLVAPPAGALPADVDVELAGTVSAPFVAARIRNAIERSAARAPGTGLDVHGVTLPATLAPGDRLEAEAGVSLDGRGTYVDVSGRVGVHVHVDPEPPLEPAVLLYSDDPEYVGAQQDGVLLHATIDPQSPARLFAYHVADGAPRRVSLVLRSAVAAHVQVLGTIGGPSPGFSFVGQQSSARFLAARASQESAIVSVTAGAPYEIPLGLQQPGDLIEAILDLRVLDGGTLDVDLVTAGAGAPLPSLDQPELPGDSHGRRGAFALANLPPIDLTFSTGGDDPPPVAVGDAELPNLRSGGRPLAGDYGVLQPLLLHLTNPSQQPQDVYLYELTSGSGGATTTIWFDADAAATTVACVDDAVQPHLVKSFTLAGGETRTVTGTYMTDGASSYPIRLGLRAAAPLPAAPGGCAPAPQSP